MAICGDSGGAFFGVIRRSTRGAELVNEIGAWTWNNLMTRELDQAKDFYGKVFDWEATHSDETPESVLMWQVEGQRWPEGLGGLMQMGRPTYHLTGRSTSSSRTSMPRSRRLRAPAATCGSARWNSRSRSSPYLPIRRAASR